MKCPACAANLSQGTQICPSCGTNISTVTRSGPPTPIPETASSPPVQPGAYQSTDSQAGSQSRDTTAEPPTPLPSTQLDSREQTTASPAALATAPSKPDTKADKTTPPPEPPVHQAKKRTTPSRLMIIVGSLLLIVILVGGGLFLFLSNRNHSSAQTTANQSVGPASVSDQGLYARVTKGAPLLHNVLTTEQPSTWQTNSSCAMYRTAYQIEAPKANTFNWCSNGQSYDNFLFQVQLTILNGDGGGIVFRANPTSHQFYRFTVYSNGDYRLFKYTGSNGADVQRLLFGSSSIIPTVNNKIFSIAVAATGQTLNLYVNKHLIAQTSDSSYSAGQIGLSANSIEASTTVVFANARLWKI